MLHRCCPPQILRLTPVSIYVPVAIDHQASGGRKSARLEVSPMASCKALPEHPIRSMEPRIIEEAHRCKQVSAVAALNRRLPDEITRVRPNLKSISFQVEFLRLHVHKLTVGRKDVWQSNRHLQNLDLLLNVVAGLRIGFVDDVFCQLLAGCQLQPNHANSAVEEVRSPGDAVNDIVLNQDATVHWPKRFQLLVGHRSAVHWRCPITPS